MATYEFARFTIDPAHADELERRWQKAIPAIRERFPGLIEANLTRIDDTTWIDAWRWETHEEAVALANDAAAIPEAAALFSLITTPPTMEFAQIVRSA